MSFFELCCVQSSHAISYVQLCCVALPVIFHLNTSHQRISLLLQTPNNHIWWYFRITGWGHDGDRGGQYRHCQRNRNQRSTLRDVVFVLLCCVMLCRDEMRWDFLCNATFCYDMFWNALSWCYVLVHTNAYMRTYTHTHTLTQTYTHT